jgi:predicted dehydrogenase
MHCNKKLRWGLLGTGNAASVMAQAINASSTSILGAVASRSKQKAKDFSAKYDVLNYYSSYEELLADDNIEAVCIALPHNLHAEWSIRAAIAKKHILCEKPAAINANSASLVIDAVRKYDVFYMEGFMYRCHPQTKKLIELLREEAIGKIFLIEASFCYNGVFNDSQIELKKISGGGGILDVGCYPISMARLIASIANKVESIRPTAIHGMAHVGSKSMSDEYAVAILKFQGDIFAQVSTGVSLEHRNDVRIFGSEGSIHIPSPWVPGGSGPGETVIYLKKTGDKEIQGIKVATTIGLYEQEINTVAESISNRQAREVSYQDTLDNMATLELWRKSISLGHTKDSISY